MEYHHEPLDRLFASFASSSEGLSNSTATNHLAKFGPNRLQIKSKPWWRKLIAPFLNLFMLILAIAAVISIATHEVLDGIIILFIMLVAGIISYVQETSSEKIFAALRTIDRQTVTVWRDGRAVPISSEKIVPGDVIELREGQKVPADCRIITSQSLRVDESLLTGEADPANKQPADLPKDTPVYERINSLFSGSYIVAGECQALVIATGSDTEFGRLASLAEAVNTASPAQQKIDHLIRQITIGVGVVSVVVFSLALYRGLDLAEGLRFVLALAVASIPESLPVAISVVLVLGARQLTKHNALIRNLAAMENIGIITTIATDKTGTLTKNQLKVHQHWQASSKIAEDRFFRTIAFSINRNHSNNQAVDPLDKALEQFASGQIETLGQAQTNFPFNQKLAMSGNGWLEKSKPTLALKGSPESIMSLTSPSPSERKRIEEKVLEFTSQGLRVIAVAEAHPANMPESLSQLSGQVNPVFMGLLAVADEIRPEAHQAVLDTQTAGVTVRMITGDHFETALAIGQQLGLVRTREEVFDCRRMDELSDQELKQVVTHTKVFSRVLPENKFKILDILKARHITAMTGDGVNDVPALTNAHIGIAMGSGSQIAKEAGDIVLLDDNFSSVVGALRQGRVIFTNIRRMVYYLLSTNAGEILTMIGALLLGIPLPLVPVQILWINIVTDTTLEIPLGLLPAEDDVMSQPPRDPQQPILGRPMVTRMLLVAGVMAAIAISTFVYFWQDHSTAYARTITFNALVAMQWANAFNARREWQSSIFSKTLLKGKLFYGAVAASVIIQIVALGTPVREFLHFVPVDIWHLIIPGLLSAITILAIGEFHKFIGRRMGRK